MPQEDTHLHIRVVAWLHIVRAFLLAATGVFLFFFLAGMRASAEDPEAFRIMGALGLSLVLFMFLIALPRACSRRFGLVEPDPGDSRALSSVV